MSDTLYVAGSGAAARLKQLEVVANNLANANTAGFRADRVLFETALDAAWLDENGEPVDGAPALSQVVAREMVTLHGNGPVSETGAPLDAAIVGAGYFEVDTPEGIRYTRAGSFIVDDGGTLATPSGHPVLGEGGVITAGESAIRVAADGRIVDAQGAEIGRLSVVVFDAPELLRKEGQNLFSAPEGDFGTPVEASVQPGALEMSNVQPVHELANLVILQRAFDAAMQTLEASDQLTRRLIQEVSG